MEQVSARLTVYFEAPFWVGVYERKAVGKLEVCKIVFGAEPKDYEVLDVLLHKKLVFSPPVEDCGQEKVKINPKRMRREIARQVQERGVGTKAQKALKLQQQEGKLRRKAEKRLRKMEEKEAAFERKHQKKKEKHRGR